MMPRLRFLSTAMLLPGLVSAATLPLGSNKLPPLALPATTFQTLSLPGPLANSPLNTAISTGVAALQPQLAALTAKLPLQAIGKLPIALPSELINGLQSFAQDDRLPIVGSDLMAQVQSLLAAQLCSAQTISQPAIDFSTNNVSTLKPIPLNIEVTCQSESSIYFSTSESLLPGTTNNNRWAVALKSSARTLSAWIVLSPKNGSSLSFKIPAQTPKLINLQVSLLGFDARQLDSSVTLEPLQTTKLFVYQDLGQELQQQASSLLPDASAP